MPKYFYYMCKIMKTSTSALSLSATFRQKLQNIMKEKKII